MTVIARRWMLDLGNSRIKCSLLDAQGRRGAIFAVGHEQARGLASLIAHIGAVDAGDEAWLASVAAPERAQALVQALEQAGLRVHRIATQLQCGRLRIAYGQPEHLGVDRFLALLAASERDDGPWLLVSAGSALTVDLLAGDGKHHGGLIAPMPRHMRAMLAHDFVQLDVPGGEVRDFATDTADALASGVQGAALGLVERSLARAQERLGSKPTLLIGGGGADLFASLTHVPTVLLPSLVLDGMAAYVRGVRR